MSSRICGHNIMEHQEHTMTSIVTIAVEDVIPTPNCNRTYHLGVWIKAVVHVSKKTKLQVEPSYEDTELNKVRIITYE